MYTAINYVKVACDRLGGATKLAHATTVSNAAVHKWIKAGRIPNIDKAKVVSVATGIELQLLRSTR